MRGEASRAEWNPLRAGGADARRRWVWLIIVLTLISAGLRLYRLGFGYAHPLVGYDDGVYLGSALELVNGHLPYRDYVFVHPPMITVLMTPDALLAKVIGTGQAMGIAKILTALAGAASVPLMARLVRHRGLLVTALACAVVAVHDDTIASAYTLLLEPWLVLFCLLGAVLVFDGDRIRNTRALWWGGVFVGVACATKIWAIAPLLALALVCAPDRRRLRRYLSGCAVGFLVPVLPFAVFAPGAFLHDVFVVQLLRGTGERTDAQYRLLHLFSVGPPNAALPSTGRAVLSVGAIAAAVLLIVLAARLIRSGSDLERFAALAGVAVVAMLFVPAKFYWHYSTFALPFLALVAALGMSGLHGPSRRAVSALLALCFVGLVVTVAHRDARGYWLHEEARQFDAVVPPGSCVVTSVSSATIADDRFAASSNNCPALVDSFGTALAVGNGDMTAALRAPAMRELWVRAYRRADFVYLVRRDTPTVPTGGAPGRYLRAHFHVVVTDGLAGTLYARTPAPRTPATRTPATRTPATRTPAPRLAP